ncbi:MAG: tetratricopeptide repeat protein [Chloroflexota bacterium]
MSQIKLSKYLEKIEGEYKSGHFSQVVAHTRQILKQYPRCIAAYRWMGRALLEQKAYTEAENIFQRVLSLDISDFMSHKGLAEIMAETNRIEQAIWHIEHAFEIEPEKSQIISMRDQYYRRAGLAAPTVNGMPLASVARLYVRGGIYDQAIEEFTRMLNQNPDRLDWKALLAISYWRIGHNTEALQLSETVLEQLPNNYQARMVLGDIWTQNGRDDIAELHLELLQNTILLENGEESEYALAAQVLSQTERLPSSYSVDAADTGMLEDWSSLGLGSSSHDEDTRQSAPIKADERVENKELNEAVVGEGSYSVQSDDELNQLIQSLEAEPDSLDLLPEENIDDVSLGTGMLDSFAAELEGLSTNGTGPLEAETSDSSAVSSDESADFDWLSGFDDADEIENSFLEIGDDPAHLSDSELNKLPNLDSLFTGELGEPDSISEEILDHDSFAEDEALADLSSLSFLDDEFTLDADETGDSEEASELSIETLFAEDDSVLNDIDDSTNLNPQSLLQPLIEDGNKEGDKDDAVSLEQSLEEDLFSVSDFAINEDQDSEIEDSDIFNWLEVDDVSEAVDGELDNQSTDVSELGDAHFDEAVRAVENEDFQFTNDLSDAGSGFTDWLEEEIDTSESAESPSESTDSDDVEIFADGLLIEPNRESADPDIVLEELMEEEVDSETVEASTLEEFKQPANYTTDALDGGLFEFLSNEENQLNALPDENEDEPLVEDDSFDGMLDKDGEMLVEERPSDISDSVIETFDILEEDLFAESDVIAEEPTLDSDISMDDLFDTSWLDAEPSEEIDLLAESADDVDVKAFAESLEGEFDLLNIDSNETNIEPFDVIPEDNSASLDFLDEIKQEEIEQKDTDVILGQAEVTEKDEDAAAHDELFADLDESKSEHETSLDYLAEDEDLNSDTGDEIEADDEVVAVAEESAEAGPITTAALIDWLMPEVDAVASTDESETAQEEDLSWLSLLESSQLEPEEAETEVEKEKEKLWTGDLSAAANAILSPNLSQENSTEEPQDESSPDWLSDVPEYNSARNIQTTRLQQDSFLERGFISKDSDADEAELEENPIEEGLFEDEADLDPIVVRESTAAKLPEWLSESTESASLGFEPNVDPASTTVDFASTAEQVEVTQAEEVPAAKSANVESVSQSDQSEPLLESYLPADSASLFSEDDLDMERDEFGNPIPPESQDLEDTLNWLEEIATVDVLGEEPNILNSDKIVNKDSASTQSEGSQPSNQEPMSDIFSGGSALHAFADLDETSEQAEDDALSESPVEEEKEVSEETLSWLDDLFTPEEDVSSGEIPTATWDDSGEQVLPIDAALEDIVEGAGDQTIDTTGEVEEQTPSTLPEAEESKPKKSMFDMDDVHITDEEISHAVEFGDSVPGMDDIPDDPESLMAWLDLDSSNIAEETASEAPLPDQIAEAEAEVAEEVQGSIAEPVASSSKPKSMFDMDDVHISDEEISRAAEFGDEVPGMDDIPDDPESLMAWLDLDPSNMAEETVSEAPLSDPVMEVEADIAEEVQASIVEPEAPSSKPKSMFDMDDVHISDEEISRAAEFGDEVPGMEDIPDDPDALMAWLDLGGSESTDEPADDAPAQPKVAAEPEEPASKPKSMFDMDDVHISDEEISRAAEFGDEVPGMEDIPDDPDALMAWLDLGGDEESSLDLGDLPNTIEDDLIVADIGQLEEVIENSSVGSQLEANQDDLDNLFDEIAGEDSDIMEEDLIFGDLGTGRLSGSDWLDKMTFDSDPALLGDVPTVPPGSFPADSGKNLEQILDEMSESSLSEEPDVAQDQPEFDSAVGAVEDLPDDPDEFMKILESDVADSISEADLPADLASEASEVVDELGDSSLPEWLQVTDQVDSGELDWLEDASPSGVFNWLDAENDAAQTSGSAEASTDDEPMSIFDEPVKVIEDKSENLVTRFQNQLDQKQNIPELIRQLRAELEIRSDPTLQKMLGDAYMETGQLQDALDAYRQAQRLL